MGRVQNKSIVVTGAAKGIGRACATLLAHEGAKVVISDIDTKLGEEAASEISDNGGEAMFIQHDVTSESDWNTVIE